MKIELPQLANFTSLEQYSPQYGDLVIWAGFFSVWFGFVINLNDKQNEINVIFGGLPLFLLTMSETEQARSIYKIHLSKIKTASKGTWAILRHDLKHNAVIWYI